MSIADLSAKSMTSIIESMEKAGVYTTDRAEDEVPALRQLIAKRLVESAQASSSSQERKKKKKTTAETTTEGATGDGNIKTTSLYRPALGDLEAFAPQSFQDFLLPLAKNSVKNDAVYEEMLQSARTMVVDVQPDGSCLFHAVFASVWRLLTGRFIERYSHAPLDEFWKATRLYDAKFERVHHEAVLGAIWHACTRSMRLYVAASLCFGTAKRTRRDVEALILHSQEQQHNTSEKEMQSDRYLVSMLQTLVCSVALERVSFAFAEFQTGEEREKDEEKDKESSILLSIAMAAQQLLARVESDTEALRHAILTFNGEWCADACAEKQSSFRALASEGYEDSWFDVDGDKTRASCFAMTFDSNPPDRILFAKSYWASISACDLLSAAFGLNIYVVVPDSDKQTLRIESFDCAENDPQQNVYLYMLGNRDHFGYGARGREAKEKEENGMEDASAVEIVKNLCGQFIKDHEETYVSFIYDDLLRWNETIAEESAGEGVEREKRKAKEEEEEEEQGAGTGNWFTMIANQLQADDSALKGVANVLRNNNVMSRAWTTTTALSPTLSAEHAPEKNILNAAISKLVGASGDLSMIAFLFADRFKTAYVDFTENIEAPTLGLLSARFQRTACPFRHRSNYLRRVRDLRPFPLYVDAIQNAIRFLIDSVGDSTKDVDAALVRVIKHYNKWHDECFVPLRAALESDCEAALRYVIARMRRSRAQPGVVPLFVLGEQMFFCDSRLFALDFLTDYAGSVNATDLHLYQLDADDESTLTVHDIVSGSKLARLVNVKNTNLVAELAYLICDSLITIILHEKQEDIGMLTNAFVFATGVLYDDDRFDHRLDAVQRASSSMYCGEKLRSQSGVYRQTVRNADGSVMRAGVLGIHALAMLEPRTCMREHFGWLGAHLRCATFVPGRGFTDLLGIVPVPPNAEDAKEVLPRLAVRFYALYKSFADPSKRQRFRPLLLRGEAISRRVSSVDASRLLSPLLEAFPELRPQAMIAVYGGVEQSRRSFFGHAPTDWCLYYHLQSFFAANSDEGNVDALFAPQVFDRLRPSMLYGTEGASRDALAASLAVEEEEEEEEKSK